jgi:hypothetical protein
MFRFSLAAPECYKLLAYGRVEAGEVSQTEAPPPHRTELTCEPMRPRDSRVSGSFDRVTRHFTRRVVT